MTMIALADRLPNPDENSRVIIYTQGHDFAGQQFFDVDADSLKVESFEHPDDQPEECRLATHWMPRPFPERPLSQPIVNEVGNINQGKHLCSVQVIKEDQETSLGEFPMLPR